MMGGLDNKLIDLGDLISSIQDGILSDIIDLVDFHLYLQTQSIGDTMDV
jgi:hypothetical protein